MYFQLIRYQHRRRVFVIGESYSSIHPTSYFNSSAAYNAAESDLRYGKPPVTSLDWRVSQLPLSKSIHVNEAVVNGSLNGLGLPIYML